MTYKKHLYFLLSLITGLVLIYTASMIFDSEHSGARSASYSLLDSKLSSKIDRITISDSEEIKELVKKNGQWFALNEGKDYPARQLRVEDFIGILSGRAAYPVRSTSASSHERLGLGEEAASRVTVYAGNSTLLDLLLGNEDITGQEIYLRKYGQTEVRSGNNKIFSYAADSINSWYNLRLIPESEDGKFDIGSIQRVSVYTQDEAQIFSRKNKEWIVSGIYVGSPNQNSIDSYVRSILNAEGADFDDSITSSDTELNNTRIVLEFGNGKDRVIRLSGGDESGRRLAHVSGSEYIYSLPAWAAQRLFKTAADFEK